MPNKKRVKKNREELHQAEASERHSKLLHNSTKSLHKEAKVVKSFHCQKIVKKIKELKETILHSESVSGKDDKPDNGTLQSKLQNLDKKLKDTKDFDIDEVVQIALRRVGLESDTNSKDRKDSEGDDSKQKFKKDTIETMLKHKRLSSATNTVSEKVSEYNGWLSRREDWLYSKSNKGKASINATTDNDPSQRKNKKRGRVDLAGHDGDTGLFIESLSGAMPQDRQGAPNLEGYEGFENYEEDYFPEFQEPAKKKNRMGQRARKAKAMAIEAKKTGRILDSSLNWREKKARSKTEEGHWKVDSASGLDKTKEIKASEVATMGKNWKEEGKAHPSWAAREAQKAKSGIVPFSGKKITFD